MKATAAALAIVLAAACARHEAAASGAKPPHRPAAAETAGPPEVGMRMPDYTAQWLDGSRFVLASQKGNVVLLNLWATWCGPCRFEIPELDKLHRAYAARGFKVIGVSVDEGGAKDVRPFVTDQKISYPIALDPDGKLATLLQTSNLPTSILVDRSGKVVWRHVGVVSTSDPLFNRALETALNARS